MLERKLVEYSPEHAGLLAAATLEGCDFTELVPNAQRYVGYGNTKYGYGPACVLDLTGTQYVAEPHVVWFPWTSARDRVLNFKWCMNLLAETREVLFNTAKEHAPFFDHFAKNGYIRKIGYIENLPIVEEIHMYQVNRRKLHV
jgi:hypothetical protein